MPVCKNCEVGSYLEGESLIDWYSSDEAGEIRCLAQAWHDKCTGCDCKAEHHERTLLSRLRAFFRPGERVDVPPVPRRMDNPEG